MQTLYTFGYLAARSERIITELIAVKTPVIDVRKNPTSKNWKWTQDAISGRPGIIYHHIEALGNELYLESRQSSTPLIKLVDPDSGLAWLGEILESHGRAAIFCACANKTRCHRLTLAALAREKLAVQIVHL